MIADEEHLKMMKRLLMINIDVNVTAAADDRDRTTLQMIVEHETMMIVLRATAESQ